MNISTKYKQQHSKPFMKIIIILLFILGITTISQAYAQDLYVYVDELPEFANHASNALYESTQFWEELIPGLNFYHATDSTTADFRVQWVKEFGAEHVGYAYGSQFLEVGLGDSDCIEKWTPYSSDHVAYIMTHEIGHILEYEHSDDPNNIMYPIALSTEYGLVEQTIITTENYVHFYPFCISSGITDIMYSVSSDDPVYGFDVYVVPSYQSFQNYLDGESISYYDDPKCYAISYIQFGGLCENIPRDSGLLIIMPPKLTNSLTELTIRFQEVTHASSSTSQISSNLASQSTPLTVDSFTLYTDPQQRFTIEYPTNWIIDTQVSSPSVVSFYDDHSKSSYFFISYFSDTSNQYLTNAQILEVFENSGKQTCDDANYNENGFICSDFTLSDNSYVNNIISYTTIREYDSTQSQIYLTNTIIYLERFENDIWIIRNDISIDSNMFNSYQFDEYFNDILYMLTSFTLTKSGQGSSSITGQQIIEKPTDSTSHTEIGTITTDKQNYDSSISTSVEISGMANDLRRGDKIILTITYPDGTTDGHTLIVTKTGDFQSIILLDRNSLQGEYEILATSKNQIVGITTFTVGPINPPTPTPTGDPLVISPTAVPPITNEGQSTPPFTPVENNEPTDVESEIKSKPNTRQDTICGEGTIYENGQCIVSAPSNSGGCLIATVAYSSEISSQVQFLREIRDTTLQSTKSGIAFMTSFNQIYYSFSPIVSDLQRENPIFSDITKLFLTPMLSSLSLITLADSGSEFEVITFGLIVIIFNALFYIVVPVLIILKLYVKVGSVHKLL